MKHGDPRNKEPQGPDRGKGPARKISLHMPDTVLRHDLETFRQKAFDLGASMAEIIPAGWVEVDERVRLKCSVPMCSYYGKNPYCPPNGPDPEFMRKALSRYSWAILYALDVVPTADFTVRTQGGRTAHVWARRNIEIAGRLETLAFGCGYHLAAGFSQVSCLAALCGPDAECQVLKGKRCAHPLQSRPSTESIGVDVFRLTTKVGWDIYPVYRSVDPDQVPRALSVGLVFIY